MSPAEQSEVTREIYRTSRYFRSDDLFSWESRFFDTLPPQARVLLGACGGGREVRALAARGHEVDAFDPSDGLLASARERGGGRFGHFAYEAIDPAFVRPPYDAVVLGWGSFAHVLRAKDREATLVAAHALCPSGPILGSAYLLSERPGGTRLTRAAERAGRIVARARRVERGEDPRLFSPDSGFGVLIAKREIEDVARRLGRDVTFSRAADEFPHFILAAAAGRPRSS